MDEFCLHCFFFEVFGDDFGTGICLKNNERTIVTEDDTCNEFVWGDDG